MLIWTEWTGKDSWDSLDSLSKKMEEVFRPARQRRFGQPMTEETLVELCRVSRDTWRTVLLTKAFHAFKNALDQARKSAAMMTALIAAGADKIAARNATTYMVTSSTNSKIASSTNYIYSDSTNYIYALSKSLERL